MNRLRGFLVAIGGVVVAILGIGMWRSPEIDWEGFLSAWSLVIDDAVRLSHDPFGILGVFILIIGIVITYKGLCRLVRG